MAQSAGLVNLLGVVINIIIVKSKVYEKSIFSYITSIAICSLQKRASYNRDKNV